MVEGSSIKKIVLWSVFSGALIISFLFLFIILLFLINNRDIEYDSDDNLKYQYLSVNTKTNETFFGIVTQPRPIESEFYSYQMEDEVILISNFGETEYECTGKCYCEEDWRRSGVAVPRFFTSSIIILLTAASSYLAHKKGEELYHEKCEEELSGECTGELLRSEVERCDEITRERDEEPPPPLKHFLCEGNCLIRHVFLPIQKNKAIPDALAFKCESYEYSGEIYVIGGIDKNPFSTEPIDIAVHKFILNSMEPFCKQLKVYQHEENGWSETLCVGGKTMYQNPSVHCREINFE